MKKVIAGEYSIATASAKFGRSEKTIRRYRKELQMDASIHLWVGKRKCALHTAIDDATRMIVGAWQILIYHYVIFIM